LRLAWVYRTTKEQDALFNKRPKVTNVRGGQSIHNYGLAFDFCLVDRKGKISWDAKADFDENKQADYAEVIKFAEKLDLESGARFKNVDMPHIQFRHGLTIQEAKKRLLRYAYISEC